MSERKEEELQSGVQGGQEGTVVGVDQVLQVLEGYVEPLLVFFQVWEVVLAMLIVVKME